MITKDKFAAYEKVRQSGVTNMFDVKTVSILSGLSREEIIEVMNTYESLMVRFPEVRAS